MSEKKTKAHVKKCKFCGYIWIATTTERPKLCPRCHKALTIKKQKIDTCKFCGHTWFRGRKKKAKICPKCKKIFKPKPKRTPITCLKCKYTWTPLVDNPDLCPYCHTAAHTILGRKHKPTPYIPVKKKINKMNSFNPDDY